jgi:DNA-binding NarL/FixJ family response regulator
MPPPRSLRVFLVEDSPILSQLLSRLLANETSVELVGHADTADSSVAGISSTSPDVVILDLHLRKGTGYDVLRDAGAPRERPVYIVLTNHTAPAYRDAALRAGARHFFDKGREIPAVLALVRRLAAERA